jgi:dimeric dUTPase (all-alpha-NTP-PPase superfamily)
MDLFGGMSGMNGIPGMSNLGWLSDATGTNNINNTSPLSGLTGLSDEIQKSFSNVLPNQEDLQKGDFSKILKDKSFAGINLDIIYDTFDLQDKFNEKVIPGWKTKKLDWWMAIEDELMEILNSVNWKWWKESKNLNEVGKKIDMQNIEVEMVDLFHFLISKGLEQNKESFMLVLIVAGTKSSRRFQPTEFIKKVRYELKLFAQIEMFEMAFLKWLELWFGMGKDLDYLMKAYRIKNALNIVRQKFGYKQGTYEKIWDQEKGLEDNVIAWKIADKLELNKDLFDNLIEELSKYYLTYVKPF